MKSNRHFAILALAVVACLGDGASPEARIPASLEIATAPSAPAVVGTTVGTFSVLVRDQRDRPLSGVVATFGVTVGGARIDPVIDTTDVNGLASTRVTLGTIPGSNQISVIVAGLAPLRIDLTSVAGATSTLTLTTRFIRLRHNDNAASLVATIRDAVANVTNEAVSWVARDPTLVSVTPTQNNVAVIGVERRPGSTYVVANIGSAIDSVRVAVQDVSSSPCDFVTTPRMLTPGEVVQMDSTLFCLRANEPDAEYSLVAHYNTALTFVTARMTLSGFGVTAPPAPAASAASPAFSEQLTIRSATPRTPQEQQTDFETALRAREARELPPRVAAARQWHSQQKRMMSAESTAASLSPAVRLGDIIALNVNAQDFCDNPKFIDARVVAITNSAIVLADTENPAGGFAPDEYFGFAMTMDTLIGPVNNAAFGEPADIDGNGRVAILFTKAVNELTSRGSSGIVLGFYYVRDLLPRTGALGTCVGSNVAEMFYLMAPDPEGRFSDIRSKSDVLRNTLGTIAHEYQHLINASRRMYVTLATRVNEEIWLNEGLSHIAEELVFFRASGRSPRQNIDGSQLTLGTPMRELFDQYLLGNFRRYRLYVLDPAGNSPFTGDARLTTRGAAWSFLRYVADRRGATDGDFWHSLVNANLVGTPNLDAALSGNGMTSTSALADWAVAVLTDDGHATMSPAFQQATWNYPTVMTSTGISLDYPLATRALSDGQPAAIVLQAGGNTYFRFRVPANSEALLQASGTALPAGMRLRLVRIK